MVNLYEEILQSVRKNHPVALRSVIHGREGRVSEGIVRTLEEVVPVEDARGRRAAAVRAEEKDGLLTVTEPFLPPERLIVLGGGHVALPVCEFGARCGFSVCVADDRPEFANAARFPMASRVICDRFENAVRELGVTPFDYVVIVTRGHRYDADCLRTVIPGTQPAYLGMIGSRRRVKAQMEMLRREGLDPERLGRVCTPIGLSIGAVTPEEIAVSILAEIIAYRRLPEHGSPDRFCSDSDAELSTLAFLAEDRGARAVVTVIEAKGSTPRGAGAKMAVDPLGRVTGSIGGGCTEAEAIRAAVRLIGTGRYRILDIDLTGDAAESEGMVCGGVMRVLVEDGTE